VEFSVGFGGFLRVFAGDVAAVIDCRYLLLNAGREVGAAGHSQPLCASDFSLMV